MSNLYLILSKRFLFFFFLFLHLRTFQTLDRVKGINVSCFGYSIITFETIYVSRFRITFIIRKENRRNLNIFLPLRSESFNDVMVLESIKSLIRISTEIRLTKIFCLEEVIEMFEKNDSPLTISPESRLNYVVFNRYN